MLHAYRLLYPDSPQTPERLWEWEEPHIHLGIAHARTHTSRHACQVMQRYFLDWNDLAQENQRLWETHYLSHGLYQPWKTWQVWLAQYRELVQGTQARYEAHHGQRGTAVR